MYFLEKRAQVICDELEKLVIKKRLPIDNWVYKEGTYFTPQQADDSGEDYAFF